MTFLTHRIYALPVLVIMPHGGCNSRCAMCDIWRGNESAGRLSRAEIAGWMESFRSLRVRRIVLTGGEPLLHPDLWGMCELLRGLPARITLLTNGLLLEWCADAVARWCDDVTVSLDGPREVHDAIRGVPGAFDELARGIAALRKRAPDLRITARSTVQRRNFRQMAGTVDAAWALGLDGLSFLAADVSTEAFNRSEPWDAERVEDVALTGEEANEFRELLEGFIATHAIEYAAGLFTESPAKLRRLARYFAALNGDGPFPPVRCNAPWVSAVVEADGAVRPCFFQPALGNLRERPVDEILNSPEARAFRRGLDVRRDPICQRCVCTLYLGPRAEP